MHGLTCAYESCNYCSFSAFGHPSIDDAAIYCVSVPVKEVFMFKEVNGRMRLSKHFVDDALGLIRTILW